MIQEIQEIGLNENEAKVYLQVLKDQGETASTIAKRAKINRTTAYLELNNLIEKGLISYIIKNNKKHFQAVDPKKLLDIIEEKKNKISKILPQLKNMHKSIEPFKIEVLEGKGGVKTLYAQIISESKEAFAFGVTGSAFDILKFEFPHLLKKAKESELKLYYLANKSAERKLSELPEKFVQIKYLPKKVSSEVTTIIFNDKVAIQSLVKENVFVTILTDKSLSDGYKSYFRFLWDSIS
jgi:HTH-type transcriptional regulator, sugar sensing transcriptional regulator